MGDESHHATVHLHLDVLDGGDVAFLDVFVLEVDARHVPFGDDVGAEAEARHSNERR